jgi:hypothetical protein
MTLTPASRQSASSSAICCGFPTTRAREQSRERVAQGRTRSAPASLKGFDDPANTGDVEVREGHVQIQAGKIKVQLGAEINEQTLGARPRQQLVFAPPGIGVIGTHDEQQTREERQVVWPSSVGSGAPANVGDVLMGGVWIGSD